MISSDITTGAGAEENNNSTEPPDAAETTTHSPGQLSEKLNKSSALLLLCRQLAKTVAESGDLYLVDKFFSKYFVRLQEKDELLPLLAEIVRRFGWDDVSASFLSSINDLPSESRMGLALQLADMLVDKPAAHTRLTMFAVERARTLCSSLPETLAYSCHRDLLWKHAMVCENPQALIDVASLFKIMDGNLLGPVVDYLMKTSLPKHHATGLLPVASKRRRWLLDQVNDIMTPFTWEIPDINFPDATAVAKYLQGPSTALVIRGFRSLVDAQARASLLRQKSRLRWKLQLRATGKMQAYEFPRQVGRTILERRRSQHCWRSLR